MTSINLHSLEKNAVFIYCIPAIRTIKAFSDINKEIIGDGLWGVKVRKSIFFAINHVFEQNLRRKVILLESLQERFFIMSKNFQKGVQEYVRKDIPEDDKHFWKKRYSYQGLLYHPDMDSLSFRKAKILLCVQAFLAVLLYVFVLCLPVSSNHAGIVMLPAGIALAVMVFIVYGVFVLMFSGTEIKRWEFRTIDAAMRIGISAGMVFIALAAGMDLWYQLVTARMQLFSLSEGIVLAGYLVCLLLFVRTLRIWKKITFTETPASELVEGKLEELSDIQKDADNGYFGDGKEK